MSALQTKKRADAFTTLRVKWTRTGRGARAAMESCRGFGQVDVAGEEQKSRLGKKVSYY
jgi:hypothetical protein